MNACKTCNTCKYWAPTEDPENGCGQLLMYRYFGNSILIDLLPELFPPGFREHERTQA
jgi:hypothetical protein